jgi:tRNA threonylcarbamoyladenosine biosynthesis protein TsaE
MCLVYHISSLGYTTRVKVTAKNEADLTKIAGRIAKNLRPGDVVALSGPLGAGKTTFSQHLLKALGYAGPVTSPTFVIEQRYPVNYRGIALVLHLDLYRLEAKDLKQLDWADYLETDHQVTLIEWPEVASAYLPPRTKTITIKIIDAKEREFTLTDPSH